MTATLQRMGLHAQVLATKSDIAELRGATKSDLAELRALFTRELADLETRFLRDLGETSQSIASTNVRVSKLETRIVEMKSDVIKVMLAALTAQTALLLALKLV